MTLTPPILSTAWAKAIHNQEAPWPTRPNGLVDGTNRDLDAMALQPYLIGGQ